MAGSISTPGRHAMSIADLRTDTRHVVSAEMRAAMIDRGWSNTQVAIRICGLPLYRVSGSVAAFQGIDIAGEELDEELDIGRPPVAAYGFAPGMTADDLDGGLAVSIGEFCPRTTGEVPRAALERALASGKMLQLAAAARHTAGVDKEAVLARLSDATVAMRRRLGQREALRVSPTADAHLFRSMRPTDPTPDHPREILMEQIGWIGPDWKTVADIKDAGLFTVEDVADVNATRRPASFMQPVPLSQAVSAIDGRLAVSLSEVERLQKLRIAAAGAAAPISADLRPDRRTISSKRGYGLLDRRTGQPVRLVDMGNGDGTTYYLAPSGGITTRPIFQVPTAIDLIRTLQVAPQTDCSSPVHPHLGGYSAEDLIPVSLTIEISLVGQEEQRRAVWTEIELEAIPRIRPCHTVPITAAEAAGLMQQAHVDPASTGWKLLFVPAAERQRMEGLRDQIVWDTFYSTAYRIAEVRNVPPAHAVRAYGNRRDPLIAVVVSEAKDWEPAVVRRVQEDLAVPAEKGEDGSPTP